MPACNRLAEAGVRVCVFPVIPYGSHYGTRWGISPALAVWIARHSSAFDIVHIHQTWGMAQVVALFAATRAGRATVVTPHESLTNYDVGHTRPAAKRILRDLYLRRTSLLVLSSQREADDSLPSEYGKHSAVIHHPLAEIVPCASTAVAHDQPLTVGFLGRLHEKKNVDLLIRAVARASTDALLRIAGDGPAEQRSQLAKIAADVGIGDRIEWLGFVPREARHAFFDSIDLLAMPSRYECFGMAAAEALARGVPTVVSSTTGIAHLVARYQCGLVTDPSVEAVSGALRRLNEDRGLLVSLAQRGHAAVLAELSMESYGGRILREYGLLLDSGVAPLSASAPPMAG